MTALGWLWSPVTRPPCSSGACDWQPYTDRPDLEHCVTAGCGVDPPAAPCGNVSVLGYVCNRTAGPAGHDGWHADIDANRTVAWAL